MQHSEECQQEALTAWATVSWYSLPAHCKLPRNIGWENKHTRELLWEGTIERGANYRLGEAKIWRDILGAEHLFWEWVGSKASRGEFPRLNSYWTMKSRRCWCILFQKDAREYCWDNSLYLRHFFIACFSCLYIKIYALPAFVPVH